MSTPAVVNSSFSTKAPMLQLAWDSTSIGLFKECPRKYQLAIIEGLVPRRMNVHLRFGLEYHAALERYDHARCAGADHVEAQRLAVSHALRATWENGRPWSSDDPNKNRFTLVRTISWYLDEFEDDPLETIVLANGKPAVELSFRMQLGMTSALTGEGFMLAGHIDRLARMDDLTFVADRKTSKHTLDRTFFKGFRPHNQFSGYMVGSRTTFHEDIAGIIVDAAQVAVTFSRFQREIIRYSESQLEEWLLGIERMLQEAELAAHTGFYRMNETACGNYGGCPYRDHCSRSPEQRAQWVNSEFAKRVWDPLVARGDI